MLWVSVLFVQCDPHKRFRGLSGPNLEATATLFITITWLMPHYFMTILESIYCYFQKTSATKPRQHWFVGREFFFFFFLLLQNDTLCKTVVSFIWEAISCAWNNFKSFFNFIFYGMYLICFSSKTNLFI